MRGSVARELRRLATKIATDKAGRVNPRVRRRVLQMLKRDWRRAPWRTRSLERVGRFAA